MESWKHKHIKDLTLDDANEAMKSGLYLVCGDGKIRAVGRDANVKTKVK